jgi:hypothetical protein
VLDTLVLDLARASAGVEHILARRRVDVATRRPQLQQKVGVGLTPAEFADNAATLGHVGFLESLQMVADGLGFGDSETNCAMEPMVEDGRCIGMRQRAVASMGGRELVRLELEMALGPEGPADEIRITGRPPVNMRNSGGIAGDEATAAIVIAAAKTISDANPGLRTMSELPLASLRPADP